MEVVEYGKDIELAMFVCQKCSSKVKYTEYDIERYTSEMLETVDGVSTPYDNITQIVRCPVCKQEVINSNKNYNCGRAFFDGRLVRFDQSGKCYWIE